MQSFIEAISYHCCYLTPHAFLQRLLFVILSNTGPAAVIGFNPKLPANLLLKKTFVENRIYDGYLK